MGRPVEQGIQRHIRTFLLSCNHLTIANWDSPHRVLTVSCPRLPLLACLRWPSSTLNTTACVCPLGLATLFACYGGIIDYVEVGRKRTRERALGRMIIEKNPCRRRAVVASPSAGSNPRPSVSTFFGEVSCNDDPSVCRCHVRCNRRRAVQCHSIGSCRQIWHDSDAGDGGGE